MIVTIVKSTEPMIMIFVLIEAYRDKVNSLQVNVSGLLKIRILVQSTRTVVNVIRKLNEVGSSADLVRVALRAATGH